MEWKRTGPVVRDLLDLPTPGMTLITKTLTTKDSIWPDPFIEKVAWRQFETSGVRVFPVLNI